MTVKCESLARNMKFFPGQLPNNGATETLLDHYGELLSKIINLIHTFSQAICIY